MDRCSPLQYEGFADATISHKLKMTYIKTSIEMCRSVKQQAIQPLPQVGKKTGQIVSTKEDLKEFSVVL